MKGASTRPLPTMRSSAGAARSQDHSRLNSTRTIVHSLVQAPDYRPIVFWTARESFAFAQRNADTWKRLILAAGGVVEARFSHWRICMSFEFWAYYRSRLGHFGLLFPEYRKERAGNGSPPFFLADN